MFGINKNGTKHKIGIIMPAFFPASRTTYDGTTSGLSATRVQGAIDAVEGQIANSSDAYSASKAYSVGDYCIYNDTLYRCVTACSAASWSVNSGCFTTDTVVGAIGDISGKLRTETGFTLENGADYSKVRIVFSNNITRIGNIGFVTLGIQLNPSLSANTTYTIFRFPSGLYPAFLSLAFAKSQNNNYTVACSADGSLAIAPFENVTSYQNVSIGLAYPIA